jgi:hypothetical protein
MVPHSDLRAAIEQGSRRGSDGKLDSVAIIALGSGANVPLVLAIQTMRAFFVILHRPGD